MVRVQSGEIELAYVDEAGFAAQSPNRSAWTKIGETHQALASRGKRLNVIGAMLSSGRLVMSQIWESINGLWFYGFLAALKTQVEKRLVVILDNASFHKSRKMKWYWELLKEQGIEFYFLPPYSPELNRIEILWRKMKYEWLPFKHFTPKQLENAIVEIGGGFGEKYNLSFS